MDDTVKMDVIEETSTEVDEAVEEVEDVQTIGDALGDTVLDEETQKVFALDPDQPINDISEKQLSDLLLKVRGMVEFAQSQWETSKREFNLTDTHMKSLFSYNEQHRVLPAEGVSEDDVEYDRFNGLDAIPHEEVVNIFGEEHPIIGVSDEITVDRIKASMNDFFGWISLLKEYNGIHSAYMELIEMEEEKEINKLKAILEKEEDEEKKEKLSQVIDNYYYVKYLDFLQEPLDEITLARLVNAFSSESKVQYWIEKARNKLKEMKISPKFILEISQLEKRFLPEKYHSQNNIFLLYFISTANYCDIYAKTDDTKSKLLCIVVSMDRLIKNQLADEIKARVLHNLIAFEEQFVGKLPSKPPMDK